ncbi:hypothetical protein J3R82DRAFT_10029 [Butyriboletus roseoflavus]|nr:hypothetical protein J3R82DRAFT_10029 [Butyriboletus roseoflavus]
MCPASLQVLETIPLSCLHPTFQEPEIHIDDVVIESWSNDCLEYADVLLTRAIADSRNPSQYIFASRALVRARLGKWDAAIDDAKKSINIQSSVIGYIAKSVALVGKGKRREGYRACDIAFEHYHSTHVTFLLLIKAVIVFMAGERDDAISRLDDLIATVPCNSVCCVVQAYMYLLLGSSRMKSRNYEDAIQSFERARTQMRHHESRQLLVISLISGWRFNDLEITIRQHLCESLYASGRARDGGESLLSMINTFDGVVYMSESITKWVSDFAHQCLSTPESNGDTASMAGPRDEATMLHANLNSTTPAPLLREWAKSTLASGEWKDALIAANSFTVPRFTIYRAICEHLESINRITDTSECFRQMVDEFAEQTHAHHEQAEWVLGKLEDLGDTAMGAQRHDDAISHYTAILSLTPAVPHGFFIKRSKAYLARDLCQDALNDANKAIMLDPSSPWGYERKHAALHEAGDYDNAIDAFEAMLSKMSQSPDPAIREHHRQYINPRVTKAAIRSAVQDTIRESPRVLINTFSGRLLDKSQQAAVFESLAVFKQLVSSMTTRIDHARIAHDVTQYYRYAMFSHKWEDDEPLFENVEYHASKVVQFYTEDWTPYMNINVFNHKESPEIISEMEEATGISARALRALRPGLYDIREKLCLASGRQTTLVEDAAYSLLGIFSVSMSIVYGDGDQALGKLLAQLLTSSGDTSILAWTGRSGSFNSCLPANIKVFSQLPTTHIPLAIDVSTAGLRASLSLTLVMKFYDRLNELPVPSFLGQRMKLPCLTFKLGRVSSLGPVFRARTDSLGIVEIRTTEDLSRLDSLILVHPWIDFLLNRHPVGSIAEMIPEENSNDQPSSLLGDSPSLSSPTSIASATKPLRALRFVARFSRPFGARLATPRDAASLLSPLPVSLVDKQTQALGLIARLRHPFGALLFTPTRQNVAEYRRVAAESVITVQVEEITPMILTNLVEGVRLLDVL